MTAETASPDAALHLGPQFVLLETAASDLVAQAAGVGADRVEAVSSHVMFLARGKVGPFSARGELCAGVHGVLAARLVLHDEGDGDRPVTAASYQFRAVADPES